MSRVAALLTLAVMLSACGDGDKDKTLGSITVDTTVAQDLQFLREEEKLARDVYLALSDEWGLSQHGNIASSEQTHMDRVQSVLEAASVEDPVQDASRGVFVNEELAALYTDLVNTGLASEVAALKVGATIEDLDIQDIEEMMARTTDETVLEMYAALQCGSRNHLRSFNSALTDRGEVYAPQFISQAIFDEITQASNEACGR